MGAVALVEWKGSSIRTIAGGDTTIPKLVVLRLGVLLLVLQGFAINRFAGNAGPIAILICPAVFSPIATS